MRHRGLRPQHQVGCRKKFRIILKKVFLTCGTLTPGSDKTLRKNKPAQKANTTLNGPRKGKFQFLSHKLWLIIKNWISLIHEWNFESPIKINELSYCDTSFDWHARKTSPSVENSQPNFWCSDCRWEKQQEKRSKVWLFTPNINPSMRTGVSALDLNLHKALKGRRSKVRTHRAKSQTKTSRSRFLLQNPSNL